MGNLQIFPLEGLLGRNLSRRTADKHREQAGSSEATQTTDLHRIEQLFPSLNSTSMAVKTLSLVKGRNHFYFRYEEGSEGEVLQSLVDMVNRRDVAFDWFDAAVLSHQLGQHLSKELKGYLPKKVA
jgi:hypothetical protein